MSPRTRRVTVRAYNLLPGDVVASLALPIRYTYSSIGTGRDDAWIDVCYIDGSRQTFDADALVTVTRTYA